MAKNAQTKTDNKSEVIVSKELDAKTPAERLEALQKDHKSISGVMRYLSSQGLETGTIAKYLGKRYQHVNNVLKQPLAKKAPAATE
jgi:hypothetical protein